MTPTLAELDAAIAAYDTFAKLPRGSDMIVPSGTDEVAQACIRLVRSAMAAEGEVEAAIIAFEEAVRNDGGWIHLPIWTRWMEAALLAARLASSKETAP